MKFLSLSRQYCRALSVGTLLFCFTIIPAAGVAVDSEVVILVDTTRSMSSQDFDNVMAGIANSFESSVVLDSIGNGAIGSIAATLVFWSGRNEQQIGVSWLQISDAASAAQFASAVRAASRPFSGQSAIGSAIAYGTGLFGTETGGAGNGFESGFQSISLMGDGRDNNTPGGGNREGRIRAARDAAIAAGVDEVSAVLLNPGAANLESYYSQNVLGSNGETEATLTLVDPGNLDQGALQQGLADNFTGPLVAIPEPGVILLFGISSLYLLNRRRH